MDPSRLQKISVFSDLSDEELRHISNLAAEVSVPEGKELVREGDYSYDVLAIEEGTARVDQHGRTVAELGPGDVFGEQGLLEKQARSATVKATSDVRLIKIEHWELSRMKQSMPDVVEQLREKVEQRGD